MDILYQIRARQAAFSAGEGRIAKLMLEDVGFAASASLEELSATGRGEYRHLVTLCPQRRLP